MILKILVTSQINNPLHHKLSQDDDDGMMTELRFFLFEVCLNLYKCGSPYHMD